LFISAQEFDTRSRCGNPTGYHTGSCRAKYIVFYSLIILFQDNINRLMFLVNAGLNTRYE